MWIYGFLIVAWLSCFQTQRGFKTSEPLFKAIHARLICAINNFGLYDLGKNYANVWKNSCFFIYNYELKKFIALPDCGLRILIIKILCFYKNWPQKINKVRSPSAQNNHFFSRFDLYLSIIQQWSLLLECNGKNTARIVKSKLLKK